MVAGLATTAVAQSNVYSLNVVGYYNVTVLPGAPGALTLIANQLNTTNNEVQYLLPSVPNDTQIYKYLGGSWQSIQFEDFLGGWSDGTWTLNPGEAEFIGDPGPGQVLTFVGEVLQGSLPNTLKLGNGNDNYSFVSSMVPQAGTPTDFQIPAENDDQIYFWRGGSFQSDIYEDFLGGWGTGDGAGPTFAVGEGFGYKKASSSVSSTWIRNFTVQ